MRPAKTTHRRQALLAATALLAGVAALAPIPSAFPATPEPAAAPAADEAEAEAAAPERSPEALAAIEKMGAALRALQTFSVSSDTAMDIVLEDGQKIEVTGTVNYRVARPNRIFVDMESDRRHRQLFFDKGKLTIWSPRLKLYASRDVQAQTLGELTAVAREKYAIDFPLADLFYWGTPDAPLDVITSALVIGGATVDGKRTTQYAFRQPEGDWQVWISDETSLPLKLVITTVSDPSMPRYGAEMRWDTTTAVPASAFTFTPPAGASEIELLPAAAEEPAQEQ